VRAPAPQPPARLVVGISEQGAKMFGDPRFRALGITRVRLVVAYDAVHVRFERDLADTWMAAARRAGVQPLVTFGHSRVHPDRLPSIAAYRAAFRAFHARYPDVRGYGPWNEPNHSDQPTRRDPARAAAYYGVVREECADCTVVAGELIDDRGMADYLQRYISHLGEVPAVWGLHNYGDANRFRDSGLRELLATVTGDVWLTETGGLVKFGTSFPRDEERAARALRFVLALASRTPRVKRIYAYNWTAAPAVQSFDSGLMGLDDLPRPAYEVLRSTVDGQP